MLKGKQRAYLRSIANTLKPSTQIGKDGVTESFLEQLDDMRERIGYGGKLDINEARVKIYEEMSKFRHSGNSEALYEPTNKDFYHIK